MRHFRQIQEELKRLRESKDIDRSFEIAKGIIKEIALHTGLSAHERKRLVDLYTQIEQING